MNQTYEYKVGDYVLRKTYDEVGGVRFYRNETEIDLVEWNREINIHFRQDTNKASNPNPLIRFLENHRRRSFLKFADVQAGEQVADIGCEAGFMAAELVKVAGHVTCVDIDPHILEIAKMRVSSPNASFIASDVAALQIPDATFDVTIASEILEHVPDIQAAVRELVRVTKPHGRIIMSLPNDQLILSAKGLIRRLRLTFLLGPLSEKIAIGHIRVYTRRDIEDMLSQIEGVRLDHAIYSKPFFLNIYAKIRRV
jgi:2-polyprenyl-3-methyl-5-hydroxy-6-metoxy-1,4-benzoquinol methylase